MMLRFRLFGFPVVVHLFFLLTAGLIGSSLPPTTLLIWIPSVFVGVLIHELGHAFTARHYGFEPTIQLHGMGGVTSWRPTRSLTTWQRVALSGAGPAVGIVVGTVAYLAMMNSPFEGDHQINVALYFAYYVNFWWAVFNLAPVLPLDGGQIATTIAERLFGPKGRTGAVVFSLALLALLALWSVWAGKLWMSFLAVVLAVSNYQALGIKWPKKSKESAPSDASDALRSYDLARTLAAERQFEEALEWLEIAIRSGFRQTSALDADPAWSELRFNPRFVALRRSIGSH